MNENTLMVTIHRVATPNLDELTNFLEKSEYKFFKKHISEYNEYNIIIINGDYKLLKNLNKKHYIYSIHSIEMSKLNFNDVKDYLYKKEYKFSIE
jgi:hypothetical protein